jgi:DNA-binding transcriptional MocR family regulator
MRLTQWTDYSLRVLMYCAATQGRDALPTVSEIAQAHGISRSHLTKIVMTLAAQGWLETSRGRGGGLRLLRPADRGARGRRGAPDRSRLPAGRVFRRHRQHLPHGRPLPPAVGAAARQWTPTWPCWTA